VSSKPNESDAHSRAGRYLLGFGILALTVLFSNVFWVVEHPQWFFAVGRPSAALLRLELAGYVLQGVVGLWLAVSLVFDVARWRRFAVFLWPLTLVLYFAPLPTARQDLTLAPALLIAGLLFWELSRTLDRATRGAD
jgi:dipeptide/tripeptide permease